MKKLSIIVVFTMVYFIGNGQDTINHIVSGCKNSELKASINTSCPRGINFGYLNDTLEIYGTLGANCCGTHFAYISKINDTIYITTADTGQLCLCTCEFCFEIRIPASVDDTIVSMGGTFYNTKSSDVSVGDYNELADRILLSPNPVSEILTISMEQADMELKQVKVYNINGAIFKTIELSENRNISIDISEFISGIYLFKFETTDNQIIVKSIIKE